MTKIEVVINDGIIERAFDVTGDPEFNIILDRKYDRFGQLESGLVIYAGRLRGHVDPKGEPGEPGVRGIQCASQRTSLLGMTGSYGPLCNIGGATCDHSGEQGIIGIVG